MTNNQRKDVKEKAIEAEVISMDDFVLEQGIKNIDFIKIDAEGAEYFVLSGAKKIIRQYKPKIILALHPASIANFGHSLESIWDLLNELNYDLIYKSEIIDRNFFISQSDLFDVFLINKHPDEKT